MRIFVLLLVLNATTGFAASQAPVSVDALAPGDVTKAVAELKQTFVQPQAMGDEEMERATLQGLLDRLAPEASLVTGTAPEELAAPFYSELYNATSGYLRVGRLSAENIEKAAQVLKTWSGKGVGAVVLDLRGTPPGSDFEAAGNLEKLFCAKGTEMFSLSAGKGRGDAVSAGSPKFTYTADSDPAFTGILVVIVDEETAEAPEAVAASLQKCAKALVVGDKTAGRAFEYRDFPLGAAVLRVAVAQVMLPDGKKPEENGLLPDISVGLGAASKQEVMRRIGTKGISSVIQEYDRPHLTEATLVSGSNPDVDEAEAEQSGKTQDTGMIDRQLQRALDLVTSISIFQQKGK